SCCTIPDRFGEKSFSFGLRYVGACRPGELPRIPALKIPYLLVRTFACEQDGVRDAAAFHMDDIRLAVLSEVKMYVADSPAPPRRFRQLRLQIQPCSRGSDCSEKMPAT